MNILYLVKDRGGWELTKCALPLGITETAGVYSEPVDVTIADSEHEEFEDFVRIAVLNHTRKKWETLDHKPLLTGSLALSGYVVAWKNRPEPYSEKNPQ